ncbi:hypothetical protein SAMN02744133_11815 [Thalassospira xiamenensis M-5 = DSM 17429]|uniref:Uncharacterized protein n=1 Tax=Thalassospira xiamenensis M-5 = DSM 17429 TaxID=1123366 RepID=A0AB72UDX3_9PROT|nr:hypothetical protein [Thalassospira xiamenensis]AJD52473.1 hypothetical protein TH3_11785 [Thalassospira xiamenensis M-5 = DSM 17429]SIT30722.1 hypothetical protein SAMN02744133_11815 [Thalassospira xiamenensis M-5 = DSM 17429]
MLGIESMKATDMSEIPMGNLVISAFGQTGKTLGIRAKFNDIDGYAAFQTNDQDKQIELISGRSQTLLDIGRDWAIKLASPVSIEPGYQFQGHQKFKYGVAINNDGVYLTTLISGFGTGTMRFLDLSGKRDTWGESVDMHGNCVCSDNIRVSIGKSGPNGNEPCIIDPWNF